MSEYIDRVNRRWDERDRERQYNRRPYPEYQPPAPQVEQRREDIETVGSFEEAKKYPFRPNEMKVLFDRAGEKFYIVQANEMGIYMSGKSYKYIEDEPIIEEPKDASNFVTRAEFEELKKAIMTNVGVNEEVVENG